MTLIVRGRLREVSIVGIGCDNAGLVFAYRDRLNYWVKVCSNAQDKVLIYQVSDGTWTQKSSSNYTISNGTPFTMTVEVRAGAADSYAASLAAGQVGLWCSDSSDNTFDDFQVRDVAGPFEVDGKWFCNAGEVRVDNSNSNLLEAYGTGGLEDEIVRRGFRGDKLGGAGVSPAIDRRDAGPTLQVHLKRDDQARLPAGGAWRRKWRDTERAARRPGGPAFAEVQLVSGPRAGQHVGDAVRAEAGALELRLPNGRVIVVRPGFDRQTLLDLVVTLEGDAFNPAGDGVDTARHRAPGVRG